MIAPAEDMDVVRELFREYIGELAEDFVTDGFEDELAGLPYEYAPPEGALLLALAGGQVAGCVALRRLEPSICEMKRMYVRPAFRGTGLGRALARAVIDEALRLGYERMRLDTLPRRLPAAVSLYHSLGFVDIAPYNDNPIPGVVHMELEL